MENRNIEEGRARDGAWYKEGMWVQRRQEGC
jgi:hypothetical protein